MMLTLKLKQKIVVDNTVQTMTVQIISSLSRRFMVAAGLVLR